MSKNPMAASLAMLNRFSSSPLVHKLGLFKPAQAVAKTAVREGFRATTQVMRQFKAAQKLVRPERFQKVEHRSDLFDLSLTEEQQLVRDMATRFAREVLRPNAHHADEHLAPHEDFPTQLGELGLGQLVVPEKLGGAATTASVVTGTLLAEDLAYGDLGLAMAALAPIGVANALVRWGSTEQQSRFLPAFAEASPPPAAVALAEPRPLFDPNELRTRATIDGDGFLIRGEKALVPLAESAELLLVGASLVGKGPRVFVVERGTQGVSVKADPALGARAAGLSRVMFDDVRLPSHAILGDGVDVCDFSDLIDLSRIGLCALAVGVGQAVLDYTIQYGNDRIAFGEPITHRQAVAFMIANLAIEVEAMRLLTWRAASRAEQGLPFHREAYLARVACMDKGMEIATNGVQLLGGHGFIKDHPVERWYRDLMTLSVMEGGVLV
ncbi:MAG: acyl-CoA dehydrogenase family protein [Polyangiales bacterium]